MADTKVSSFKLVGGDMAGTKSTMQETVLEESNRVCMVDEPELDAQDYSTYRAIYHIRAMGGRGYPQCDPVRWSTNLNYAKKGVYVLFLCPNARTVGVSDCQVT